MKSIIQDKKECYVCGSNYVEDHHCMFGTSNRKLSEKYGLKVWLCPAHHRTGQLAVHRNSNIDLKIKQEAQNVFMKYYNKTVGEFIEIFGKNYI